MKGSIFGWNVCLIRLVRFIVSQHSAIFIANIRICIIWMSALSWDSSNLRNKNYFFWIFWKTCWITMGTTIFAFTPPRTIKCLKKLLNENNFRGKHINILNIYNSYPNFSQLTSHQSHFHTYDNCTTSSLCQIVQNHGNDALATRESLILSFCSFCNKVR